MGQEQSSGDNALQTICGLQVARVLPRSPAHISGLLPFFDIIIAVDHTEVTDPETAADQFRAYIAEHESQQVCFRVYNLRIRAYRDVFCTPTKTWGGGGMLGCSIEWSRAITCLERSWHITDILPESPVGRCGEVRAGRDYIIGLQRAEEAVVTLIKDEDDFYTRVELWRSLQRAAFQRLRRTSRATPAGDNENVREENAAEQHELGKLLFLIYDSEANEIKEVSIDLGPDVDAPLGMNIATGLLHSLLSVPTRDGLINSSTSNNNNSNSSSNMNNNNNNNMNSTLPVLTTFISPLGVVEKAGRISPSVPRQTSSVVNSFNILENEKKEIYQETQSTLLSTPIDKTKLIAKESEELLGESNRGLEKASPLPIPPITHSLPQPNITTNTTPIRTNTNTNINEVVVEEEEEEKKKVHNFMSTNNLFTSLHQNSNFPIPNMNSRDNSKPNEVNMFSTLKPPFLTRPIIPAISRSRPTNNIISNSENNNNSTQSQQQEQHLLPQPPDLLQQHGPQFRQEESQQTLNNNLLVPSPPQNQNQNHQQQEEQHRHEQPVELITSNLEYNKSKNYQLNEGVNQQHQQQQQRVPRLPPPLQFPIIRPSTPRR